MRLRGTGEGSGGSALVSISCCRSAGDSAAAAAAAAAATPDAPARALLLKELERLERLYYSNAGQTPPQKPK